MGLFKKTNSISVAEEKVRDAEDIVRRMQNQLDAVKFSRDQAKQCGNYKNAAKNYRSGSKVGNVYDANVWAAEDNLKKAKERLAAAKREFAEVKKK